MQKVRIAKKVPQATKQLPSTEARPSQQPPSLRAAAQVENAAHQPDDKAGVTSHGTAASAMKNADTAEYLS